MVITVPEDRARKGRSDSGRVTIFPAEVRLSYIRTNCSAPITRLFFHHVLYVGGKNLIFSSPLNVPLLI